MNAGYPWVEHETPVPTEHERLAVVVRGEEDFGAVADEELHLASHKSEGSRRSPRPNRATDISRSSFGTREELVLGRAKFPKLGGLVDVLLRIDTHGQRLKIYHR